MSLLFIQSVRESVTKQLINAANTAPSLRVAVVTFANDVSITENNTVSFLCYVYLLDLLLNGI